MYKENGVGLAAPQIGENVRVFVIDVSSEKYGRVTGEWCIAGRYDTGSKVKVYDTETSIKAAEEANENVVTIEEEGIVLLKNENNCLPLKLEENNKDVSFRVRRIPTSTLLKTVLSQDNKKQHKKTLVELSSRFVSPFMNLILALVCTLILLKSSLLRRRTSFAPTIAVLSMAGIMASYMSVSNTVETVTNVGLLCVGVFCLIIILIGLLLKK